MLGDILLKIGAVAFMVFFFGFCIFIHELGHFLAAKWRGLHVIAFSIGFRKIWSKKIGGRIPDRLDSVRRICGDSAG